MSDRSPRLYVKSICIGICTAVLMWASVFTPLAVYANDSNTSIPAAYDLRDQGLATQARSQFPFGSCWAFGAMGALESNAIKQGFVAPQDADFSERHLVWFGISPLSRAQALAQPSCQGDQKHSQEGEGINFYQAEQVSPFDFGGYTWTPGAALATGIGIQKESDFPYVNREGKYFTSYSQGKLQESSPAEEGDWSCDADQRFAPTALTLKENLLLPNPRLTEINDDDTEIYKGHSKEREQAVKQAILSKGAVVVNYYLDGDDYETQGKSPYFNYDHWAAYCPFIKGFNHSSAIIGWDDTYPKENFENTEIAEGKASLPPADGAWIVKNSWGCKDGGKGNTYIWGKDGEGVFYLSYYDQSIDSILSFEAQETDPKTDICFQYDFVGLGNLFEDLQFYKPENNIVSRLLGAQLKTANVFTTEKPFQLEEVGLATLLQKGSIHLNVYILDEKREVQDALSAPYEVYDETFDFSQAGYRRHKLVHPVNIPAGARFAIALTIQGTDEEGDLVCDRACEFGYTKEFIDEVKKERDKQEGSSESDKPQEDAGDAADTADTVDAASNDASDEDDLDFIDGSYIKTVVNPGESFTYDGSQWHDNATWGAFGDEPEEIKGITVGNNLIKGFGHYLDKDIKPLEAFHNEMLLRRVSRGLVAGGATFSIVFFVIALRNYKRKQRKLQDEAHETGDLSSCGFIASVGTQAKDSLAPQNAAAQEAGAAEKLLSLKNSDVQEAGVAEEFSTLQNTDNQSAGAADAGNPKTTETGNPETVETGNSEIAETESQEASDSVTQEVAEENRH